MGTAMDERPLLAVVSRISLLYGCLDWRQRPANCGQVVAERKVVLKQLDIGAGCCQWFNAPDSRRQGRVGLSSPPLNIDVGKVPSSAPPPARLQGYDTVRSSSF